MADNGRLVYSILSLKGLIVKVILIIIMMPKLLLFPFLIISIWVGAQNLVPDPGFEIHNDPCTDNWPGLTHWFNPNTATPDLMCTPEGECNQVLTEEFLDETLIPIPFEGNCMAGLYCCTTEFSPQSRDYFSTQLIEPLVSGTEYVLSFYLSRMVLMNLAIDRIGAYFSNLPLSIDNPVVIEVTPQAETSGEVLTPDLTWLLINLTFIAEGGEQYLTLGNFREYNDMTVVNTGSSWKNWDHAYYFFDNVTVQPTLTVGGNENFELIQSAHIQKGNLYLSSNSSTDYFVYDLLGRRVLHGHMQSGIQIEAIEWMPNGIYIVQFRSKQKNYSLRLWKE